MITLTIVPRERANLYGLLIKKEVALRNKNTGTLHRSATKRKDREKWSHATHKGWINLQKGLGGVVVASVQSKSAPEEWQLLSAFVGFIHRHFSGQVLQVNMTFNEA